MGQRGVDSLLEPSSLVLDLGTTREHYRKHPERIVVMHLKLALCSYENTVLTYEDSINPFNRFGFLQSSAHHVDTTPQVYDPFLSESGRADGRRNYHQDVFKCLHFQTKKV